MKSFKRSSLPDTIQYKGQELKYYGALSGEPEAAKKLQNAGHLVCLVEVHNPRLKGKDDLHGKPYGHSTFIFWKEVVRPDKLLVSTVTTTGKWSSKLQRGAAYLTIQKSFNTEYTQVAVEVDHTSGVGPFKTHHQHTNALFNISFGFRDGGSKMWSGSSDELRARLYDDEKQDLFDMVRNLKKVINRLSQDGLSQHDRDNLAHWEGEAHELLLKINPNYYKNANEK